MLETLISSKTRIKLLLKFFLNSNMTAYLRSLETEFGESTNGIRLELNRLEEAGMLSSFFDGNKKMFRANTAHPLFGEIHNILLKTIGLDQVVLSVIERLGDVEQVFLVGEFAKGNDSPIIDLVFIGEVDKSFLLKVVERVEELIKRKIRYLIYGREEFDLSLRLDTNFDTASLLLWSKE
ncbi:MAG: ArsR family transcriptional regulator [Bacteroidales bacterium]|nr:ArsR family transcriptional regulator [Bacteroidales bacterium]MCF8314277.1 ArsR family transcriptional regulator [Saprospiraceae bacterium]MCF8443104.1 ArsR family transcriptional regulator [Saprospiraceae bacterium]